jgi:broad specificity phosphatase PhoE
MNVEIKTERKENPQKGTNIRIIRHGHKDKSGKLSPEGQEKTRKLAEDLKSLDDNLLLYSSDIQRSQDTANIIGSICSNRVNQTEVSVLLSEKPYTDERISELGLDGGKWLLSNESTRGMPSIGAFAGKLAKFIQEIDEEENDRDILAISHVPPIMAFLGFVIADSEGKNEIDSEIKEELHEIFDGGFPKPLEGFEINKTDDTRTLAVKGNTFNLSDELLDNLTERCNMGAVI